ncbi:MAG TPA: hypothetical protein VFT46_02040 [Holophagaceae bacterium]|nr:hypothetical protein [Holophagaceae bacterium]
MVRTLVASLALALLLACGGGSSTTAATATPAPAPLPVPAPLRTVAPATTDPAISTYLDEHVVAPPAPAATPAHRLFVLLPGTGARPSSEELILQTGSSRGYHVIGLEYPNGTSIASLCNASTDPDAHWKARSEVITGQDLSTLVDVGPAECIEHRLTALLTYLASAYPAEDWGQYLAAGQPDWSRIVIAGHSQGGGHAGVIAKLHPVYRCVCLSSPADYLTTLHQPATWYGMTGATDASKIYGFSHQQDEVVTWTLAVTDWTALGLDAYGPPVNVDGASAPYGGSHMLTTNLPHAPTSGTYPFHGSTSVDFSTPLLGDGTPAYQPVWIWLCFP